MFAGRYSRILSGGALRKKEARIESPRRERWSQPSPDIY
jgi:hypothetical protein